jgi:hypothetical protein
MISPHRAGNGPFFIGRNMKIANIKKERHPYHYDLNRIVKVMADYDYLCSYETAEQAWSNYSDMFAAGWLTLPESDFELYCSIKGQLEDDND